MNTATAIKLAKAQARLWDARRGIREVLDAVDAMIMDGQLQDTELRNELIKAKEQTETALAGIMGHLEEVEE